MPFFGVETVAKRPLVTIENPQTIGEHLRKRRLELKVLQKDVAVTLGVSEDTITGWENGRYKPYITYYPKIIQFLRYNPFLATDTSTLGGRMKKYRIENGVSQEGLSKLVGVSESTIWSWENGEHKPFAKTLEILEAIIIKQGISS